MPESIATFAESAEGRKLEALAKDFLAQVATEEPSDFARLVWFALVVVEEFTDAELARIREGARVGGRVD